MKSRRRFYRFDTYRLPVKYRTAYDDGDALLLNISTGGCALENVSTELAVGDRFLLHIEDEKLENPIEAQAEVVRADNNVTAAEFKLIEGVTQTAIRTLFSIKK